MRSDVEMALSDELRDALRQAIRDYDFPFVTYDFVENREIRHQAMREVEERIRGQLLADEIERIRDGFSNILYWGYARIGYRWNRVTDFRERATASKLLSARTILRGLKQIGVRDIAKLRLPQFSGLSFVSKVRMFIDPANFVVLDTQLLKLKYQEQRTIFDAIAHSKGQTIRITKNNEAGYELWCKLCRQIATTEFSNSGIRAADVERGVFHLIRVGRMQSAVQLVSKS